MLKNDEETGGGGGGGFGSSAPPPPPPQHSEISKPKKFSQIPFQWLFGCCIHPHCGHCPQWKCNPLGRLSPANPCNPVGCIRSFEWDKTKEARRSSTAAAEDGAFETSSIPQLLIHQISLNDIHLWVDDMALFLVFDISSAEVLPLLTREVSQSQNPPPHLASSSSLLWICTAFICFSSSRLWASLLGLGGLFVEHCLGIFNRFFAPWFIYLFFLLLLIYFSVGCLVNINNFLPLLPFLNIYIS